MKLRGKNILVTGGAGFLGRRVVEELTRHGAEEARLSVPRSVNNDLRVWEECRAAVEGQDIVVHTAGAIAGIGANREHPGKFFYDNAIMGIQLIEAARQAGVEKFVTIGSVCEYPKFAKVPFIEDDLWKGYPEETNAPYGLAKKMLLVQGQSYRQEYGLNVIHLLLVNLYGPGDNFDLAASHAIPAFIRKFDEAKRSKLNFIEAWGTGTPTREFLYVDDAVRGVVLATLKYDKPGPVNLGSGMEISIKDLAEHIGERMHFEGEIRWDKSKPDGQPRRRLDTSKAEKEFGFKAKVDFEEGLSHTIEWYNAHRKEL